MDIFNPISLDDPEFFQKVNAARPDLFNQEQMAKNIEDEKSRQSRKEMMSKQDTNQASEDELKAIIEWYVDRAAVLADQDGRSFNNKHLLKLDMGTAIEDLIRTEKLKLLAEVRERVVGEDDLVDAEILKKLYDKAYSNGYNDKGYESLYNSRDYRSAEDMAPVIAKIRGGYDKRFAALTKLEAEL